MSKVFERALTGVLKSGFLRCHGVLHMIRILATLLLSLSLSPAAWGHVTIDPKEAPPGSYAKLTFRVPHGCAGSATTKVRVLIPEGVTSVKPQVHPGWT